MIEWAAVGTIAIICVYKLIDRWLDQRESEPGEHRATYSTHERGEDGWGEEAHTQVGFRSNDA